MPSGGGKTTLLKMLIGLNQPSDGAIELDGQKATPEMWRAWRQHAGVVAQDDRLLSGSIADNIGCFDPDLDMQRVQEAAIAAQVHADIMRTPMQYLTLVGDMGSTLSGGQRQRVLLARALYRKPKILFLDEGTANLDEHNEELIADLIEQMPITRIVVAHRPALIRRAHHVYVVGNRQIVNLKELAGGQAAAVGAAAAARGRQGNSLQPSRSVSAISCRPSRSRIDDAVALRLDQARLLELAERSADGLAREAEVVAEIALSDLEVDHDAILVRLPAMLLRQD